MTFNRYFMPFLLLGPHNTVLLYDPVSASSATRHRKLLTDMLDDIVACERRLHFGKLLLGQVDHDKRHDYRDKSGGLRQRLCFLRTASRSQGQEGRDPLFECLFSSLTILAPLS